MNERVEEKKYTFKLRLNPYIFIRRARVVRN